MKLDRSESTTLADWFIGPRDWLAVQEPDALQVIQQVPRFLVRTRAPRVRYVRDASLLEGEPNDSEVIPVEAVHDQRESLEPSPVVKSDSIFHMSMTAKLTMASAGLGAILSVVFLGPIGAIGFAVIIVVVAVKLAITDATRDSA